MDTLPSGTVVVANGATGLWASAAAWTLAEDLRIGSVEGDDAAAFGRVGDIAVDRAGRIYVLDRQAQQVRVFGPDGAYLRTVGRKGGGPGEFTGADHLHVDDSLRLWVSDRQARRFSAFDSAGALLGDSPRPGPGFSPNFVGGDAAGSLWDWWWIYDAPNELSRKDLLRFGGSGYRDTLSLPAFGETQWQLVRRQGGARPS